MEKRQIGEERRWQSPLRDSLLMPVDLGEYKEQGSSLPRGMLEGTELLIKSS